MSCQDIFFSKYLKALTFIKSPSTWLTGQVWEGRLWGVSGPVQVDPKSDVEESLEDTEQAEVEEGQVQVSFCRETHTGYFIVNLQKTDDNRSIGQ